MSFEFPQKVLFKHCDPAGIVFFPRYFEMINDCVEAFFDAAVRWSFVEALRTGGLPTAEISTRFTAPSHHGDELVFKLKLERVGATSIEFETIARCAEEKRLVTRSRLVRVGPEGRPEPWPEAVGSRLQEIMEGQHGT